MSTPGAWIIHSATVDSASADLNAESDSDVATANATSGKLCPTVDSALETLDAKNGSDVVRQPDVDTTYRGDKSKPAEVRSTIVVDSADTGPHVDDKYNLPEVLLLRGTGTEIGVTSSATTVFDPGGIGYSLDHAGDGETAWHKAVNSTGSKTVTEPVPAELSWEDDECNSTGDPIETLRQHYLAIAATEDEQEGYVDDSKTDIFQRSGTDLELTDYAHELAFLPDLADVEPT
ncbi:hypothetical protein PInf_017894 [Phytophthora infestans]|nr:hypothetical protein PInf_017894 [Phytophthora infestans]